MGILHKTILLSMIISNFVILEKVPASPIEKLSALITSKVSPLSILQTGAKFLFKWILRFPNEISKDCANDVKTTFMELLDPKMWSNIMTSWPVQMLDSLAKPPSGLMQGHIFWLGSYQECIDVVAPLNISSEKFIGEYCLVNIYPKRLPKELLNLAKGMDVSMKIGLCFPSTCSFKDKSLLLNHSLKYAKKYVRAEMTQENCQTRRMQSMDATTIVLICTLSSFGILVLLATLIELASNLKKEYFEENMYRLGFGMKLFLSFSAITSLKAIFQTNEERSDLRIIHGIRAISIIWIVTGHTILYATFHYPWRNQKDLLRTFDFFLLQPFTSGASYSVTSFFAISGFLVTHLFIQRSWDRHQSPNIFGYYIFRYFRLTPPLILVILALSGPFYYVNKGPIWPLTYKNNVKMCRKLGWMSILYIQNFQSYGEACFPVGWYLSADTQLYILAPIILYPLYRKPLLGVVLMGIFLASTTIASMSQLAITGRKTFFGKCTTQEEIVLYANEVYCKPYLHASSFIIGMIAGYLLHLMQRNSVKLLKKIIISCWICAITIIIVVQYGTYPYFNCTSQMSPWMNVMYGSLTRPAWALAISWIILASALGYGGIVNRLLTLQPFVIVGRLTYCIYLVHSPILDYYYFGQKDGLYFSIYNMVMATLATIVMSMFAAVLLAVIIEMPIINMLKHAKEKYDTPDRDSRQRQLTFPAANFEKAFEINELLMEDSSQDEKEYEKN